MSRIICSNGSCVLRASTKRTEQYIMLHAPIQAVEDITDILPGSDAPTILELQGRIDKVAIHAVCNEGIFWETMEELEARGASDILALPIEKMLTGHDDTQNNREGAPRYSGYESPCPARSMIADTANLIFSMPMNAPMNPIVAQEILTVIRRSSPQTFAQRWLAFMALRTTRFLSPAALMKPLMC